MKKCCSCDDTPEILYICVSCPNEVCFKCAVCNIMPAIVICKECAKWYEEGKCPQCKHSLITHIRKNETKLYPHTDKTYNHTDKCRHEQVLFTSVEKCGCICAYNLLISTDFIKE